MENENFFELDLEQMEQVSGGKKHPYVRSTGKKVSVHSKPSSDSPIVAYLGYLDEVPASGEVFRDKHGVYWARIRCDVNQGRQVTGWVSRKHAEPCWN